MSPQQAVTQAYTRLLDVFLQRQTLADALKTVVRYDQDEAQPRPLNPNANDYPMLILETRGFKDSMFTKDPVMETFDEVFNPNTSSWIEVFEQTFKLTLVTRLLRIGEVDMLGHEVLSAMRAAGPKLGLSYVTGIGDRFRGLSATVRETDRDDARGTLRLVTEMMIPIEFTFEGRQAV